MRDADIEALDVGLEAYLRADAPLRALAVGGVWFDLAPQAVIAPYVIYRLQSPGAMEPTHDAGGFDRCIYQVSAVDRSGSAATAIAIARRLRQLLTGARFLVQGWEVIRCERWEPGPRIAFVEPDGDQRLQHRGALWDIWVAPLK